MIVSGYSTYYKKEEKEGIKMKKILKNNKGFTLIELLAVIVVLAIIMVIATQQVNSTIKKSRGNSFFETVQSIRKSMQTVCATDNGISPESLAAATSASDITIKIERDQTEKDDGYYGTLTVTANTGGKFTNVIYPEIGKNNTYTTTCKNVKDQTAKAGDTITAPSMSFRIECPVIEESEWDFDTGKEITKPTTQSGQTPSGQTPSGQTQ